jgi:hypothetical protein
VPCPQRRDPCRAGRLNRLARRQRLAPGHPRPLPGLRLPRDRAAARRCRLTESIDLEAFPSVFIGMALVVAGRRR